MKKIYTLLLLSLIGISSNAQVVISQVYGGGGNAGATYTNDFIEIFNRGTSPQDLTGWSVQYASATGTSWQVTPLTSITLQPKQYYLIQQAAGGTPSLALPAPDATGTLAMSGSNGKVLLAKVITAQTGLIPTGVDISDLVGYGATPTGFEGTGPTGTALTNSTAAFRKDSGCTDTNDNAADFVNLTPSPKNTASPISSCAPLSVNQNSIAGLKVYPNPVVNGTLFIDTDANAVKNISVFDVLGKQVLNTTTSNNSISVSSLNNGIYIVKITEEGKTVSRKLVIK